MGRIAVFLRSMTFFVYLIALLISGGNVLAEDKVNAEGINPETVLDQGAKAESEIDAEQKIYPGVENRLFKSGTPDEPHVTIYYPAFGNEKVDEIMREFAVTQGADYEKSIQDAFAPDEEKPDSYEMWEMTGMYTLSERPSPEIVSVTFNIYSYTGGAHGNIAIQCINASLATGKQLEFADLFGDTTRALEILSRLSEEKLRAELGDEADDEMLRNGTTPELNNFLNLSLNPGGLSVDFQPYQVGPWSIGVQKVQISLEELAEAKPNPSIWSALSPDKQSGKSQVPAGH